MNGLNGVCILHHDIRVGYYERAIQRRLHLTHHSNGQPDINAN